MHNVESGADKTLKAIESGGSHLLSIARQRIGAALDALDAGDFVATRSLLGEAANTMSPLANAQAYIAVADNARLIKVGDVEVGMTLHNMGVVTEAHLTTCEAENCGGHMTLKIGEHEWTYDADQRVYVRSE